MNIKQLIAALQRRAIDSDEGYSTEVKLTLHVLEHNGSGYYIETEIADVANIFGGGKDEAVIETILTEKDLNDLQRLKSESDEVEG